MKLLAAMALLCALAGGCELFDKQARQDYEEATKRWNAGDYKTATALYIALVKEHPLSPYADNALYWVGTTQFLYLGETDKALRTFEILLKKYPRRDTAPQAQLSVAQIYELGYNDYERAIVEFRKAVDHADGDVRQQGLYSLADNLFRVGRIDEARDTWMRQVKEFPRGSKADLAFYRLGTTAYSRGEMDAAVDYYRKALTISADRDLTVKTKYALAQCLEADENLKEALALYKELEPLYQNKEAIQIKIRALEGRIVKKSY